MKLLYVTSSMEIGGVETNLVGLCGELCKRGHEVWVASSGGALEGELTQQGARHVKLPLMLRSPVALLASAFSLRTLIQRERFDVVHTMSAAANLAVLLAPRHTRVISSPMGLQNSDREPAAVTLLRNWLMRVGVDSVLTISPEIERAMRAVGVPRPRLVSCQVDAIDFDRFRLSPDEACAIRREFGIAPDEPVITTIGALHPRKSHHLFIAAAAKLLLREPRARFLVVGEGPLRAELEEQAQALGIASRLALTGQRRDVAALLGATTVYVKPGVVEGFVGITVLEAMAAGKPVVAFRTRDVEEAIRADETGLLVPPADVSALAEAIAGLLAHPENAAQMAARARTFAERRFGLDAVVSNLERVYGGKLPCAA